MQFLTKEVPITLEQPKKVPVCHVGPYHPTLSNKEGYYEFRPVPGGCLR